MKETLPAILVTAATKMSPGEPMVPRYAQRRSEVPIDIFKLL